MTAPLIRAWLWLVGLSALTTGLVLMHFTEVRASAMMAGGLLLIAGLKARIILRAYLELDRSRFWSRTFEVVLTILLAACFALYLIGVRW